MSKTKTPAEAIVETRHHVGTITVRETIRKPFCSKEQKGFPGRAIVEAVSHVCPRGFPTPLFRVYQQSRAGPSLNVTALSESSHSHTQEETARFC